METKIQTQVTDQNRVAFYQQQYIHQTETKAQLINLDQLPTKTIILVDCCGWHYKSLFFNADVICFETFNTIKNFKLDKMYFDKIIDNQSDSHIGWPTLQLEKLENCAIIFDRSSILKYFTIEKISSTLNTVTSKYQPLIVVLRQSTMFIDGPRLLDRFYELSKLSVDGYIVKTVEYQTDKNHFYIEFQRKLPV
jgi:hypothetical protein